ncbi:hypothetical protein [Brevibacillus sp. NRS-1366]
MKRNLYINKEEFGDKPLMDILSTMAIEQINKLKGYEFIKMTDPKRNKE